MKNNKGFSLVELIIVIAIMAILVGVMAPQLIKYIEKTNVSADTQLADAVHSAVLTAIMDPEIATLPASSAEQQYIEGSLKTGIALTGITSTTNSLTAAICDILGVTGGAELATSLKSHGASVVSVRVDGNRCSVWLPGTDSTGSKQTAASLIISVY